MRLSYVKTSPECDGNGDKGVNVFTVYKLYCIMYIGTVFSTVLFLINFFHFKHFLFITIVFLWSIRSDESSNSSNNLWATAEPCHNSKRAKTSENQEIVSPPAEHSQSKVTLTKDLRVFPCQSCDKTFPVQYRLNRHVREVHIKEKDYKCNICTKEFFKSSSLLRHQV